MEGLPPTMLHRAKSSELQNGKSLANFPVAQKGLQLVTVIGPESGFFNAPLPVPRWEGETKDPPATWYKEEQDTPKCNYGILWNWVIQILLNTLYSVLCENPQMSKKTFLLKEPPL